MSDSTRRPASDSIRKSLSDYLQRYWPITVFIGVMTLLQLMHSVLFDPIKCTPSEFSAQPWQILGCHWIHANWSHYWINIGSLIAVASVLPELNRTRFFFTTLILSSLGVSLFLWLFDQHITWYTGFSGVLYGFLISAGLIYIRSNTLAPLAILFVVVKVGTEQFFGPLPGSERLLGGAVAVQAHLYGALSGTVLAAAYYAHRLVKR